MVTRLRDRGITDERVLDALATVPRERFVPAVLAAHAYRDRPLPIGEDQTISTPWIVAVMAAALELTGTESVLEVGGGAGYAAAVLPLRGPGPDHRTPPPPGRPGPRHPGALGYDNVEVRHGDGTRAGTDRALDAISIAAISPGIPAALRAHGAADRWRRSLASVTVSAGPGGSRPARRCRRSRCAPRAVAGGEREPRPGPAGGHDVGGRTPSPLGPPACPRPRAHFAVPSASASSLMRRTPSHRPAAQPRPGDHQRRGTGVLSQNVALPVLPSCRGAYRGPGAASARVAVPGVGQGR